MDQDRGAEVESRLGALDQRLADTFDGYSRRRSSADPLLAEDVGCGNGNHIRPYILPEIYADFKEYVDELDVDMSYAEAVRRAMREHRHGGREQRMTDRLEDMTAAVGSAAVDTPEPETTDESESNPYNVEDKIEAIRADLEDQAPVPLGELQQIPETWITESVDRWCVRGDRDEASERTRSTYIDHLCDTLGFVDVSGQPVIENPDMLDGLPFERRSFDALSTDQRVEAVHVKLARKASSSAGTQGRAQFTASDIQNELFETEVGESVAHKLRAKAADADGFHERDQEGREKAVAVDLVNVTDETILKAEGVDESSAWEKEVAAKMDNFVEGEPVMAGGSDSIEGDFEGMEKEVMSPQQ